MFESSIRLALAKSGSSAESEALRAVLSAAVDLDREERDFGRRVDENKASRGEAPTKLSKRRRSEVDLYSKDADALTAHQLAEFERMGNAKLIILCLHTALQSDVLLWSSAHRKAHPDDVPIIEAFCNRKRALLSAMSEYLRAFDAET